MDSTKCKVNLQGSDSINFVLQVILLYSGPLGIFGSDGKQNAA